MASMPTFVQDFLNAEAASNPANDPGAQHLLLIAEVNRAFRLGEPLRITARRRWWDILAWRLALELDHRLQAQAQEDDPRGRPDWAMPDADWKD